MQFRTLLFSLALAVSAPAAADIVVERFPSAGPLPAGAELIGFDVRPFDDFSYGQSVTIGTAGKLVGFDLLFRRALPPGVEPTSQPFHFQLYDAPDGKLLAEKDFFLPQSLGGALAWVSVDLSSDDLIFSASQKLFATAGGEQPGGYVTWLGLTGASGLYAGGESYTRMACRPDRIGVPNCDIWQTIGFTDYPVDLGYRAYIDTSFTAVPEPSSWAVLIAGFGLAGGVLRRRRSKILPA